MRLLPKLILSLVLGSFSFSVSMAETAPARQTGSGPAPGAEFSSKPAVTAAFATCTHEQKQALIKQGCIEHFEQYPDALQHARPCQQSTLEYSVTRALTIIPKCSLGVGKAWVDHGKDLLNFLQGAASSVSERMSKSNEALAEMRRCNQDETLQTKRLLLQQHNLTDWQDDRIRRSTCEEIIGYGARRARSTIRNNAIQSSVDFASLPIEEKRAMMDEANRRNAEKGREAWNQAYNSIQVWMKEKVGIPLACYNAQKNDELICYGVARIVTPDAVAGGAVISRMRSIAGVTGKAGEEAAAAGGASAARAQTNAIRGMSDESRAGMLARNSTLTEAERAAQAERMLATSRPDGLTQTQRDAVIKAHNVGEDRGYGTYTRADLDEKARILREAGFNADERQALMRSGIAGQEAPGTVTVRGPSLESGDTARYIKDVPEGVADRQAFGARVASVQHAAEAEQYKKAYETWQALDKDLSTRILQLQDIRAAGPALELKNRQILELKQYQKTLRETYEDNRYNY